MGGAGRTPARNSLGQRLADAARLELGLVRVDRREVRAAGYHGAVRAMEDRAVRRRDEPPRDGASAGADCRGPTDEHQLESADGCGKVGRLLAGLADPDRL